jgi:formamidopyrimidine-DNA glycosylase
MPEAPDLFVIRDYLEANLTGLTITKAEVLRPIVLRSLAVSPEELPNDMAGRAFTGFWRRGKFLGLVLSLGSDGSERLLVVNPMLSGGLQHCAPSVRVSKRTYLMLTLSDGQQLRYVDDDQMGMIYYLTPEQLPQVPRLTDQGPDVLDEVLTLEEFKEHLKHYRGEIKGVLTRGGAVSGIGNAYVDEVLFAAGLFPFKKLTSLSKDELAALHHAVYTVPANAIPVLQGRMGSDIHRKVRDFLKVHGRGNQPCPACGTNITHITNNRHLTDYCRTCQPGSLIGGRPLHGS